MSKKTKMNVVYSITSQMIIMLLTFFNRQFFVVYLGSEILGINGVILNILAILQLAELGISTALTFFFYQPLLEGDYCQISRLLSYAKSVYRIIAIIIFGVGLSLLPFIRYIIKTSVSNDDVIKYYCLILINSVLSYTVIYKSLLLIADQKIYIINLVKTIIAIFQNVMQIYVLKMTSNYCFFLLLAIVGTVSNNIIVTVIAGLQYRGKISYDNRRLNNDEKDNILGMIKATAIYRIGVIIVNNTDNILISVLVNTVTVGVYSNYLMVISAINTFISTFISSITAKLGEINAIQDFQKSYEVFCSMLLLFHYVTMLCSCALVLCLNDFIQLFFGVEYILGMKEVIAIVVCFYIQHAIDPIWIYRETMGLFNEIKYVMLFTAVLNLVFSFILGKSWGLSGIVVATGLSRLFTTVWYEPRILFEKKFLLPVSSYFFTQLKYLFESALVIISSSFIIRNIPVSIIGLLAKAAVAFIISSVFFCFANSNTEELRRVKAKIKKLASLKIYNKK